MPEAGTLIVRFGSLGDVVLTFATGAALKRAHPDRPITYLVKSEYADLVARQPWADAVWPLEPGAGRTPGALLALRRRIADAGFTAVLDLQTNLRSRALLAGLPGVHAWRAERLARRRWVSWRWTHPAPLRPAWRRYLDAARALGVNAAQAPPPVLALAPADRAAARAFFDSWGAPAGSCVALAPGARWATKRWPEESYRELAEALVGQGARVVVLGEAADRAALPDLAAWVDASPGARWFTGTVPEVAAVLAQCRAGVTNDSGLMHVAAAVGVPLVAIFGSTAPALGFSPAGDGHRVLSRDLACQPCTLHGRPACPLGHHACVRDYTAGAVGADLARLAGSNPN